MTVEPITDPLSHAAALLDAVGADRDQVPADIALDCLYAAELLELAGARPRSAALVDGDPRVSIRTAMGLLAAVDEKVFTSPPVLDAARAARHALHRLG